MTVIMVFDPEYQKKEVGSAIMSKLKDIAKEKRFKGIITGTKSRIKNFYIKNGLKEWQIFLKYEVGHGI